MYVGDLKETNHLSLVPAPPGDDDDYDDDEVLLAEVSIVCF